MFVLTHHARPTIAMDGNTSFHFVTGGGPHTIQQYLHAGLVDELHIAIAPALLGRGGRLFEGVDMRAPGHECVQFVASDKASHAVLRRAGPNP